jgi:putative transposase
MPGSRWLNGPRGGSARSWAGLADVTEHRTAEGKLYLCAIKDVYSNRIVGYSIDARMKSRLAVAALHHAVARRGDVAGCVLHTDRGSQFRSRKFVHALNRHDLVGSMGRSVPPATTPRWSRSSACCRRTSSTAAPGTPRGTTDRDRDLDREDLPPAPTAGRSRTVDPCRIRTDHDPDRHPGGLTETVTRSCSRPVSCGESFGRDLESAVGLVRQAEGLLRAPTHELASCRSPLPWGRPRQR